MSRAIHGTGEFNSAFDKKMEAIQKLKDELASEDELSFEVKKICDWINSDSKVRRNLNAQRFRELSEYRHCCPNHDAWEKIELMIRTREAQNSVARKKALKEQHGRQPVASVDFECPPVVNADIEFSPIISIDAESEN
jgi:hypothetical protein